MENLTDYHQCFAKLSPYPTTAEKLTLGIPLLILNITAFASNGFLVWLIYRRFDILDRNSVFLLMARLSMANMLYLCSNFVGSLPGILWPRPLYGNRVLDSAVVVFNNLGHLTVPFVTLILAFDRIIVFYWNPKPRWRDQFRFWAPCGALAASAAIHYSAEILDCNKRFDPFFMGFTHACSNCMIIGKLHFTYVLLGIFTTVGVIIFICYVLTFFKIFELKSKTASKSRKFTNEVRTALNFLVLGILLCFATTSFMTVIPLFGRTRIAAATLNSAMVLNALAHPIATLLISKKLKQALKCKTTSSVVSGGISVSRTTKPIQGPTCF